MSTSEILGLVLLTFGFGVRMGGRLINLERIGISSNAIKLSGLTATLAGFIFFFFLDF